MANWTEQSTSSLLPGEPLTSAKVIASFENPVAIAEGAVGAPFIETAWHPATGGNVGTDTGIIWDQSVDGNLTASLETSVFVAGYDYGLVFEQVSNSSSALTVSVYSNTVATWQPRFTIAGSSINVEAFFYLPRPMRSVTEKLLTTEYLVDSGSAPSVAGFSAARVTESTARTYDRFRINAAASNLTAGRIRFVRRRNYLAPL